MDQFSREKRIRLGLFRLSLQKLEAPEREVLMLRYIDGLAFENIASKLGISSAEVEARIHRAKNVLRRRLKG
jgi:RNA polymerase sigma factor (sigma-70 family)